MWETVSALSALISVFVSITAVFVALFGTRASSKIATEALKTARQANDIALGRVREPPALEFIYPKAEAFDFTEPDALKGELSIILSVHNTGHINIDGLLLEIIGITSLTYPLDNTKEDIRPLPFAVVSVPLTTLLQPDAIAHIDMRLPILLYLQKLRDRISDRLRLYTTTVNIVLQPKAVGDRLPSDIQSDITKRSRHVIAITFRMSILDTEIAMCLIEKNDIAHRVYAR